MDSFGSLESTRNESKASLRKRMERRQEPAEEEAGRSLTRASRGGCDDTSEESAGIVQARSRELPRTERARASSEGLEVW